MSGATRSRTRSQNLHLVSLRALDGAALSDKWTWRHDNREHRLNRVTLESLIKMGLVELTYFDDRYIHRGRPCVTARYALTESGAAAAEQAHASGWRHK